MLEQIEKLLNSYELRLIGRLDESAFTRNRILKFNVLILLIINLIRKSLQLELNKFGSNIKEKPASKQAFSQARKKLDSFVFKAMNSKFIEEMYTDNDYKLIDGMRILAVDGSKIQLPSSKEIINYYGCTKNHLGDCIPAAMVSTLFDVTNKVTLDAIIAPVDVSERSLAMQHIKNVLETNKKINFTTKDLFMFDRGYPSMEMIIELTINEKAFLMRCPSSFISEIREAFQHEIADQIVQVKVFKSTRNSNINFKNRFPDLDKNMFITLRILTFTLSSGEKEVLITSLLDQKKVKPLQLFNLYHSRWDIEENYKFHKAIAELENFSGKSKLAVEQDFHATVFTCNMANMLAQETLEEITETTERKGLKYEYTYNKNIALGALKDELIYALYFKQDMQEFCDKTKTLMARSLVPKRKNRSFPRKQSAHRKYSPNRRNCL